MSPKRLATLTHWRRRAAFAGMVSLALCLIAVWLDRRIFLPSYLVAWLFFLGLALGSLSILLVHQLTGGRWGNVISQPLFAAALTLPLLTVLFLPLLVVLPDLFVWAAPTAVAQSELVQQKHWYLNVPGFDLRAATYFVVWIGLVYGLRRLLLRRDRASDAAATKALRRLSIGGLIAYVLTMSGAAVDWIMSLTPEWYSTNFGLLTIVGQALSAFAFVVVAAVVLIDRSPTAAARDFHELGN